MQTRPFGELADGRTNNYDFLRFLFAAAVILAHSFPFVGRGIDPLSWISLNGTYSGDIAVDGFFAISGCLVTASWLRSRGLLDYFKKRVLRIYPGFLVASAICLLIVGPLGAASIGGYFHAVRWGHALTDLLLLNKIQSVQSFVSPSICGYAHGQLNGPLWSIKIEFECYILVAILGLVGLLRKRAFVLAGFLLAHIAYIALAPQQHAFARFEHYFDHFRCLTFFMAGMTFYVYRDRIPRTPLLCWLATALIAICIAIHHIDWSLPVCGGYLLFYGAYNAKWRMENFGEKRDLSYGLYVYGWPVQLLLITRLGNHMNGYEFFVLSFAVAALCALASWTFIESPALRLKGRTAAKLPMPPRAVLPSDEPSAATAA